MTKSTTQTAIRLFGLGVGLVVGLGALPAIAQTAGGASERVSADDGFQSAENGDGFLGSDVDVWDFFHRARSAGVGVTDAGFYRSQNRQLNRQAESLRQQQEALIEQRTPSSAAVPETTGVNPVTGAAAETISPLD